MDDSLVCSHTGLGGSDPDDRMRAAGFQFEGRWTCGENIAYQSERGAAGIADDVEDLHFALMNSPGPRANILNPKFEVIGIRIDEGDNRGFDAVHATQKFAATDAPLQLDTCTPTGNLSGSAGEDRLVGADADDLILGWDGNDTLEGGEGNDRMFGGGQADLLRGGTGNHELFGGDENDTLFGDSGNDVLSGGVTVTGFWAAEGTTRCSAEQETIA